MFSAMKPAFLSLALILPTTAALADIAGGGASSDFGGFFVMGAAYDGDLGAVGVMRDGEIYFSMTLAADDGWTITGRVELEATSNADQIDEAYISVDGAFGRLRLGQEDGAKSRITNSVIYAPGGRVGYYGSGNATGVIDAGAGPSAGGDAIGIFYDSPSFEGFRFGVSWQPDTSVDGGADSNNVVFSANNRISAGVAYDAAFDDILLGVNGALFNQDDAELVWAIGGYAEHAGLRAALHYEQDGTDEIAFGAQFKWDAWTIGAGVAHETRAPDNNLLMAAWVGADLAPGVLAAAGIERHDDENDARAVAGIGYIQFSF